MSHLTNPKADMMAAECLSFPPHATLELSGDDVHVWCVSLDQPALNLQQSAQTLSIDERKRAGRFCFEADRKRFVVCRGLLRTILSCYLNIEPRELQFRYGTRGKPSLAETMDGEKLRFNLAHSKGLALYAVSRNREIGVDVERIHADCEWWLIADRFFSAREKTMLHALPPNVRHETFFTLWALKEAYMKARGDGLSLPLNQFDVSLSPGEPTARIAVKGNQGEASRWSLYKLTPPPGYAAALAVEGRYGRLKYWHALV